MIIKQMTVRLARTINLGHYENVKPEIEMVAELTLDDDPATAFEQLYETVRKKLAEKIETLVS